MVPGRKLDGKFMKDRNIHGKSTIQRLKKINKFDIHAGFE